MGWRMNKATITQVAATREAGTVRRAHIIPHHGVYNVAQHSYGAASLLLLLNPDPSIALVKAVLWHDVAERWMGDVPAPVKMRQPELAEMIYDEEERILGALGLAQDLRTEEVLWLRAVDTLDLWLWSREEEALGNRAVIPIQRACEGILEEREKAGILPPSVSKFYRAILRCPHQRLSDFFDEVAINGIPGFTEAEEGLGE